MMTKLKSLCDGVAACGAFAGFIEAIPTILGVIASALSIAWYLYRFWQAYKEKKNGN